MITFEMLIDFGKNNMPPDPYDYQGWLAKEKDWYHFGPFVTTLLHGVCSIHGPSFSNVETDQSRLS